MLCPCFLWFCTSSTLYPSFSLIIFSNSVGSIYCSFNWSSLHCVSRSSLNTLCITHPFDNFSWNASCPIFFVILKVYISFGSTSLRVVLTEYSLLPTTCCLLALTSEGFIFFCQTVFYSFLCLFCQCFYCFPTFMYFFKKSLQFW